MTDQSMPAAVRRTRAKADQERRERWSAEAAREQRVRVYWKLLTPLAGPEAYGPIVARLAWMCHADGVLCGLVPESEPAATVTMVAMGEDGPVRDVPAEEAGAVELRVEARFRYAVPGEITPDAVALAERYLAGVVSLDPVNGWRSVVIDGRALEWPV